MLTMLPLILTSIAAPCGSRSTSGNVGPTHYVFFARDHDRLAEPSFLSHPVLAGALLTYTWRQLEPARDQYNFDELRDRLDVLRRHGKRLFVQVQDVSFSERSVVPEYLRTDSAFHGGDARKYEGDAAASARFDGWVARRWDPAVRARFVRLLEVLAQEFDGRIEGIVRTCAEAPHDEGGRRGCT